MSIPIGANSSTSAASTVLTTHDPSDNEATSLGAQAQATTVSTPQQTQPEPSSSRLTALAKDGTDSLIDPNRQCGVAVPCVLPGEPSPILDPGGYLIKKLQDGAVQSKADAEALIQVCDTEFGKGYVDTPLEDQLLHHWIEGSGSQVSLPADAMTALKANPVVSEVSQAIASGKVSSGGTQMPIASNGTSARITPVTLENGEPGYRADIDLKSSQPTSGDLLDGSLGKARVYFDAKGQAVGVLDSYDFSNDGIAVQGLNTVGASVGAKNFLVRGGVVEEKPDITVPPGPDLTDSAIGLIGEGAEWAGGKVAGGAGWVGDKVGDGAKWVGEHNPFA